MLAGPAAYPAAAAERGTGALAVLAATGVGVLGAGSLLRLAEAVPAGLALVGAEYAVFLLLEHEALDLAVPLLAAAFVLSAELAHAAIEPPLVRASPGLAARRAARVAARTVGAAAVAVVVLAVSVADVRAGLAVELAGIAAAVAALALVALLARRAAGVR